MSATFEQEWDVCIQPKHTPTMQTSTPQTDIVQIALSATRLDAPLTVIEFIKVTNYPIDTFLIDRFWGSLREGQLIYVDDELIRWMGYEGAEAFKRKQNFMKNLSSYSDSVDYFYYTNAEYEAFTDSSPYPMGYEHLYPRIDRSVGKSQTKHLLLTAKCLKTIMMRVNTSKGSAVREYYFALEELIKKYIEYQTEYKLLTSQKQMESITEDMNKLAIVIADKDKQLAMIVAEKDQTIADKDKQLAIEKNKNLSIQNFITNVKLLEKNEYIYIATSTAYAAHNQYKIGRSTSLKGRIYGYNSGRADGDNLYYCWIYACHDSLALENRIKSLLANWRSNKYKEMYVLNYNFLVKFIEFICTNDNDETEVINTFLTDNYADTLQLEPIIPPPLLEYRGTKLPTPTLALMPPSNDTDHVEPQSESPQTESQTQTRNIVITPTIPIPRLNLTAEQAAEIVIQIFQECHDNVIYAKEVGDKIKLKVKPKKNYKANDWSKIIEDIAKASGITIRKRKKSSK